jgi:hypothetical protein
MLVWILSAPGAGAQNSGTPAGNAEVVHAGGKDLTLRFTDGQIRQFEIPASAAFRIDGRRVRMPGLKPGMKLTASVSTADVPAWVDTLETVDVGTVWKTVGNSIIIKTPDGENKMYKVPAGGRVSMGGVEKTLDQLHEGDKITATVLKTRAQTGLAGGAEVVKHPLAVPVVMRVPQVVERARSEESNWPWGITAILAVVLLISVVTILGVREARERRKA